MATRKTGENLALFNTDMIVLRSCDTFQTRTIVLYWHAMVVSKLSCVNLLQGKFEEKRNRNSYFWTSENFNSNINFSR